MDNIYDIFLGFVEKYPHILLKDQWTVEKYHRAFTIVVTRCFGWSLPSTMLMPYADCLNHFHIDSQYEVFQKELHYKKLTDPTHKFSVFEEKYFTPSKMSLNFKKTF